MPINYGELAKQFVTETYGPMEDYPGEFGQEAWLSWLGQATLVLEWYERHGIPK